jgi:hypothetical protein
VVADAVRDLLTATLRGRLPDPERTKLRRSGHERGNPWDDPDDWAGNGRDDPPR